MALYLILGLIGLLPSLIWLTFFLFEDRHEPEPKLLLLSAFLLGGSMTFIAFFLQLFTQKVHLALGLGSNSVYLILTFALLEELLKFLVVFLLFYPIKAFDEPIDAMIYLISVSLGFAAVENIVYILKTGASQVGLETIVLRFMGATLLHALSSGIIGYAWGKTLAEKNKSWISLPEGLILGTIVHFFFNVAILRFGFTSYILLFLICVAFFVLLDFERLKTPINLIK